MKRSKLATALAAALALQGSAGLRAFELEEVTIVGSREVVRELPGTGNLVDNEQVRIEFANDINQLLKTVPGLYIREEDGYGLRPNIGIRGATSERASKVTLMEDGVMIAPAPYSNPAAYYFPTALRMHSIEVIKGAPLLRYGPQTTGGVINMVTTPIPEELGGNVNLRYGQNNEADLLANVGDRSGAFGFLLETAQRRSDGFKEIDGGGRDAGYEIQDYLAKVGWEGERQSLLLKAQYSEELSDETYLGLTDANFAADENRRYGISAIDEMDNEHTGLSATYRLAIAEGLDLTAIAYRNEFKRNWFKLGGGGGLVNAANSGDAAAQGILDGTVDATGLPYKNNAREYISEGIDLNLDIVVGAHELALGGRVHDDDMQRYQPVDLYDQINGELVYRSTVLPTGGDNRYEKAEALTLWAVDRWQVSEAFTVNLALRYENVESRREQFADPERVEPPSVRSNETDEWLPGASFTYDIGTHWQVLAGVHRGFSPLGGGAVASEEPETSVNYEAGFRYSGGVFIEAVAFYSDFENKSENCSNADPCSNGATAGSFVTGEAEISGLEFQLGGNFDLAGLTVPVDVMYTYTQAKSTGDNTASGVLDGDRLASIPENVFSLRAGLESPVGWDNYAVIKYIDEMCVDIGCNRAANAFATTEDLWVVDVISRYALSDDAVVFLKMENLLDDQAIVSRQPDGARPNKPRTASIGVQWAF
ncbi:TonB-dependent receptor family protein [Pseudohaliea rubra]|uniref:Outer membrane receptor for Fe3+-dicitrate n=1 Tax=Pseudohaliea rubra DSM 19751 TaxID=1265313 RepID=A0A095VTZ4_9GAMM|nr:TonB-dependent receptor [Pseudohaliea rubra]KGE04533.1 Outer membrane receptor for Fe3+-dicitrate [Pseudohaliea rubra DSM 19751]